MSRSLVLLATAMLLAGCGRFSMLEAAQQVAYARGCEEVELSIVQARRAEYEVLTCGEHAVYRCRDRLCDPLPGARPSELLAREIAAAREALSLLEDDVMRCIPDTPRLTVRVRFRTDGRVGFPVDFQPALEGDELPCVGRLLLRARSRPLEREMLLSHTFGAASQD